MRNEDFFVKKKKSILNSKLNKENEQVKKTSKKTMIYIGGANYRDSDNSGSCSISIYDVDKMVRKV